jgi:DUF4097 and DUF4098 domain-containing protein YvlB
MIGSTALLSTLLLASAASERVHVPRIEVPLRSLAMAAQADENDEEEDEENAARDTTRMQRERREAYRDEMRRRFGDDEGSSGQQPTARAAGKDGSATLAVKGPITFSLRMQSGEAEVVASNKPQVTLTVSGTAKSGDLQLVQFGDRVEAEFGGHMAIRHGRVRVELPKGSNVDFSSTSGDVAVENVGGDVRVRTMSGDVKIAGARNADVNSISSDVNVSATGPRLRLHVVSGNTVAATTDPAVQLDFESASGTLQWSGVCAKGCHVSAQTVSGDIKLQPDTSKSSFALSYASHSGDLHDELNLDVKRTPKRKHGGKSGWFEAAYGKGEGVIECDAFSGDLIVTKK